MVDPRPVRQAGIHVAGSRLGLWNRGSARINTDQVRPAGWRHGKGAGPAGTGTELASGGPLRSNPIAPGGGEWSKRTGPRSPVPSFAVRPSPSSSFARRMKAMVIACIGGDQRGIGSSDRPRPAMRGEGGARGHGAAPAHHIGGAARAHNGWMAHESGRPVVPAGHPPDRTGRAEFVRVRQAVQPDTVGPDGCGPGRSGFPA